LVLKVLKTSNLSETAKAQIRQKVEHLRVLSDPLLITPVSFGDREGVCFITQDYFDGVSLDRLMERFPTIPLKDFFIVACQLAQALDKVHEAGIIHGGIKPHNILVDNGLNVRLIDFITTVDVRDISHFIYDRAFIRDTLVYTSPEQTGRINHRVVFSSDLYSLGIVFYEMLTGRVPFLSDDPLELIHHHLAREAPAVHELNPDVPMALSNIIAKLMVKEPEKRYQSCRGLLEDLLECKNQYDATGTVREFPLEKSVSAHRVAFISKMVGRDREAEVILGEYEGVVNGEFRSLFISGLSGIGKTRLIQELQGPIVEHRGYFTSGKFDVYQKNIPYSSLIQALSSLMRTFLTESDERMALWRGRIREAVGQNGKVLTDVIPELEILIGIQPEVSPLPPVESLNRFHDVFDRFLGCLASKENPLTLFIDDLQWCDVASFDFFENLFSNHENHPYLFFLGAYRHNEVDSSHPLTKLIRNVNEHGQPLKEIRLGPLRPEHCHEMVSYILDSPLEQTKTLSDFISTLTEGNPLFVSESLSYLYNEDLLYLDSERQWRWDLEKIRSSRMPTTVVALFSSKIQRFPPELRTILEYCACLGNTFSPAELSLILEKPLVDVFETLKPSLGQGLIIESKSQLQFIHDKVQEAALFAIPAERRCHIHWRIGNHLLSTVQGATDLEKVGALFTIVSHLNLGRGEHPDPKTAYLLSDLNYYAGNKALNSLATEAANEYFNMSRALLPDDCWDDAHYERTFRILQKAAKTELMCGHYESSERLLDDLLAHASTDLDKAECLAEQTTSLSSIGNFIKAIETANRGLAFFGKAIPENPEEADRKRQELMDQISSGSVNIWETILNMPFTTDRKSKIELAFYSELIPDLYMSGMVPQLYLSAAQSTQHCLAGGMDESVIYSFSIMGLQLGEREEFEQAFRYEDLARDLSAKYPNTFGATRGMNGIVWCNMHSRSHPREIVDYCLRSIQCGKNCGDLYNAGLSYGPLLWNLQVHGADFTAIDDYAKECLQFSNRYHLSFSVGLAEAMQAGWIEPMKKGYIPAPMNEKLKKWEQENHVASAGSYCIHRALTHYYLGEHKEAEKYLIGVKKYLSGLTDNVLKRQWYVFRVLNTLKLYEMGIGPRTERELLTEVRPLIEKIKTWAALGPLLKPYFVLLQAELERVTGEFREARSLYLDAADVAEKQGYTFLEGYINECLGELLRKADQGSARMYFSEAARLYRECHAERKEAMLIGDHPQCLEEESTSYPGAELELAPIILPDLDVEYLMKASLAISSEIEQEALLRKIVNIVMESSGAQHGYLLTEMENGLCVRAESHSTEQGVRISNERLEDSTGICKTIVRYVYRTGEQLVLGNASHEGPFKESLEVRAMQLRSVLCLPVVKQSKTVAILYLENRLSNNVFTSGKTGMTRMLASYAAVSLENAALFDEHTRAEEALRRTGEELRKSEQRWATTLASIGDAVIASDADGKITFMNAVAEELTGWTLSEVFLRPVPSVFRIINEQTRKKVGDPVAKVLEMGVIVGLANHTILVRKDGSEVPIDDSGAPIRDRDGRIIGVVVVFRDVTERKRMEREILDKADNLTRSNAELKQFAYVASHDLQEPLRMVTAYLSLLEKKYGDRMDGEAKEYIKYAVDGGLRARQLIGDLLEYSRVDSRSKPLQPTDMESMLNIVLENLKVQIAEEKATITHDVLPTILADDNQMAVLIQNLISNAIKFHGDEDPIVHISCRADGAFWLLSIQDNGIGIDPQYFDKIFVMFQRLYTQEEYEGTGIGLAIAKKIVERHGGRIWVESDGVNGSTFLFTLPRDD
jgi:PAS domain S-box-containing protein